MQEMNAMYRELGISSEVLAYGNKIEKELKERFDSIDENAEYNQMKVLLAMQKIKSARHVSMHPAVTDTTIWEEIPWKMSMQMPSTRRRRWSALR